MKTFLFIDRVNSSTCMVVADDVFEASRILLGKTDIEDEQYKVAGSVDHVVGTFVENTIV